MPIKWSAVKVSEACDRIEAQLTLAEPFVAEAERLADEARKLPNLPQYVDQKLANLAYDLGYRIGALKERINSIRKQIPNDALKAEREQAEYGNQGSLI